MLRSMIRRSFALLFCATLCACSRSPSDPALVENPAPLTDCSDDAFISILGGGRAVVCVGEDRDPQVRACIEAPLARGVPFAHVSQRPGVPPHVTVRTPEKDMYQVWRFTKAGRERVEMYSCGWSPVMPADELPFFCPQPGGQIVPVHEAGACGVLERARKLRRLAAEQEAAK